MAQRVRLQYIHPMKAVRALVPQPLAWTPNHHGAEQEYCSPQIVQKGVDAEPDVYYEVSEAFARRLLGNQSDRYFLVSPAKLIVPVATGDGFSTVEKLFTAVAAKKLPSSQERATTPSDEGGASSEAGNGEDAPPAIL